MQLLLDAEETTLLHHVIENYLDQVRDAYGSAEHLDARPQLTVEQEVLERILKRLHTAGVPGVHA